jgi:hypothetical protein
MMKRAWMALLDQHCLADEGLQEHVGGYAFASPRGG